MRNQKGFTLIELMIVIAIIGVLAAIAIPQYQNYIARSQAARIMSEAGQIRTAVELCVNEGRTEVGTGAGQCDPGASGSNLLEGAAQTAITLPANTGVPQVSTPIAADATITATFGNAASGVLATQTLTWTRNADGAWECTTTIEERFRPRGCEG